MHVFYFAAPQQQVSSAMEFVRIQKKVQYHERKLESKDTLVSNPSASVVSDDAKRT